MGRGGSSSGSTSDYGLRGPEFDSNWEPDFFLSSYLSYHLVSGASLIRSLKEVEHYWFSTLQVNNAGLAVQLRGEASLISTK